MARRYFYAGLLPTVLVLLFVAQNVAFNEWLHVVPQLYPQMYAAAFALGVLLYGPAVLMRPRARYIYLFIVSSLVSALLIAEYLYFSYAGGYLQISALKLTAETSAVTGTAIKFITPRLSFFLLNSLLVAIAFFYERYKKIHPITLSVVEKIIIAVVILTCVFGGYEELIAAEVKNYGDDTRLYKQLYDLNSVVGKMGVVNYFLEDATKRLLDSGDITEADKTFVNTWSTARPDPVKPGNSFGVAKGRNLIFIQVESLENAVINTKLGDNEITPNLNELAHEGLYFSNYFTQVGMGNTADAEFVTLDSLYPLPDSVAFVDHAQNQYAALPQLLVDHGYDTAVFHGDVPTFWNRADIYPSLGYQTWFMRSSFNISRPIGITGVGDQDLFQQSLPRIESLPRPFMATLITLSSHTPFFLPDDLRTLPIPKDSGLNDTQTQYLESIHYADQAIGDFITQLKQTSLYDNSVIVIFGDHGSYTDISSALGVEKSDVADMNNGQVPLIILAPGTGLTGEQQMPSSHLDLYPTVAHLLGLDAPMSRMQMETLITAVA